MASLLNWRPKESFFAIQRVAVVLMLSLLIGVPAAFVIGSYKPTTLSEFGEIIGDGKIVVLEPEKWIGKRFPLLDYIDIGDKLKEGRWLVLLYHHDCPDCRQAIENLSHEKSFKGEETRVALIEVPPYGDTKTRVALSEIRVTLGRLDETRDWFVSTPTKAWLDSNEVRAVTSGNSSQGKK